MPRCLGTADKASSDISRTLRMRQRPSSSLMAASKSPRVLSFICHSCRQELGRHQPRRAFASSLPSRDGHQSSRENLSGLAALTNTIGAGNRSNGPNNSPRNTASASGSFLAYIDGGFGDSPFGEYTAPEDAKPHRLHVLATKHNTHITLVQPPKPASLTASSSVSGTSSKATDQNKVMDVLLSLSTGNLGFRKAGRGSYDAAYQLAAFALKQIQERGMRGDIRKLEVVLRGFGPGREAVTKALLGAEGRSLRGRITSVVDATRLKLGGPRSKKPRRLG